MFRGVWPCMRTGIATCTVWTLSWICICLYSADSPALNKWSRTSLMLVHLEQD